MSNDESQGLLFEADSIRVWELEFDDRNLQHFEDAWDGGDPTCSHLAEPRLGGTCLRCAARHRGIDEVVVGEVLAREPAFIPNKPGRSGSHRMVGPDSRGKIWTIIIVEVDEDLHRWRPITGWPATPREERSWRGGD